MKKALKISAVVVALVVLFAMAFVFTSSAAETTVGTVDELTAALASETETVVKLGTDLTIDATINVGGQITLDLNGHTITSASTGALFNQAGVANPVEFKITDSVGGGAIIAADATLIGNNIGGTAKIEGGAIVVGTAVDSTNTKVTLTVAQSETYKTGTWTSFNPNQSTVLGFKGYATTEANYVTTTVAGVNYYVSPEVYTIEYIVPNGATHTNVETFTIWDNVTFTDATAAGYDFDGWYNGEEEIEKIDAGTEYHSIVLTGKFTAKTYTITYEGLNGATHTNPADFKVTYANVKLTDATKTGYTFLGWYTEANGQGTRVTEIACSTTTENVTVYAHFEAITYTITYVTYGGTTTNTLVGTYTIEDTFNFETLSKDGYNWDAWYTSTDFNADNVKNGVAAGETGNITVYANYTIKDYTITYQPDADNKVSGYENFKGTYTVEDETFTLETPTVAPGYTFVGWKNADGVIVSTIPVGTTGDITLTAVVKATVYKIFYNFGSNVNFSDVNNDANAIAWGTFLGGQSPELVAATRTHYVFLGWSYTNPETEEVTYLTYDETTKTWSIPATTFENVTVYAVWGYKSYDITYDVNGYKYQIKLQDNGQAELDANGNVQYVDANGNVTTDPTLFVPVTTFETESVVDFSTDAPATYTYFDAEVVIPSPTRPGYTFVRWYDENTDTYLTPDANGEVKFAQGTRSGDLDLVAEWEIAKYEVVIKYQFNDDYYGVNAEWLKNVVGFEDEGRTFKTFGPVEYVYGTPIAHEVDFRILNGFVPEIWALEDTMGAEDTTYVVYFEPIVMSTENVDGKLVITYHDGSQKVVSLETVTGIKYQDGKVVYVDENGNATVVAATAADIAKAIDDLKLDELKAKVDKNAADIASILAQLPEFVNKADFTALQSTVADLQTQVDAVASKATTNLVLIIIVAVIAVAAAACAGVALVKKK